MISLLGVGVFWGSYPRICRAKGTNQNFRKFRLSANWQPCSPSRPSLSRFVGTSRTERTPGYEVANLVARANGRNVVGCYMLRPFAHPVACCWSRAQSLKLRENEFQQLTTLLGQQFYDFTKFIKMCIERARKNQTFRGVVGSYCVRLHVAYISTNMICTNVFDILADLVLQVARPGTQMQWCAIITGVVTASLAESKLLRFFKAIQTVSS